MFKTSLLTALLAVALTTAVYDLDSKAFAQKKKEYQEIFLRKVSQSIGTRLPIDWHFAAMYSQRTG